MGNWLLIFLKKPQNAVQYLQTLAEKRTSYPGFNLLAGNTDECYYYSNIQNKIQKLEPGIYGVSNHLLNTEWPKVKKGKAGLEQIIRREETDMKERLFKLLQNADPAEDHLLPNTGVSKEWERILSPLFIKTDYYGTRSSTVFLLSKEMIYYQERVFLNGEVSEDQVFHISL
ncbi:MAG TPA: NRDE family protein [Bacillus sp. (in: firmicutes)]|nr:NRDE family protein [Bacillus sp. (in: firmicutes)]